MITPAAMEPSRTLRRVSIGLLPDIFFGAFQAAPWPKDNRLFAPCTRGGGSSRATKNPGQSGARLMKLLPRRRAQSVPGVTHLMVMHVGQVVRRIEVERLDIEPADGGKQRIGGDHAVAQRADQPRLCRDQILLRVEHVDGGALAAGRLALHAL